MTPPRRDVQRGLTESARVHGMPGIEQHLGRLDFALGERGELQRRLIVRAAVANHVWIFLHQPPHHIRQAQHRRRADRNRRARIRQKLRDLHLPGVRARFDGHLIPASPGQQQRRVSPE